MIILKIVFFICCVHFLAKYYSYEEELEVVDAKILLSQQNILIKEMKEDHLKEKQKLVKKIKELNDEIDIMSNRFTNIN